MSVAHLNVIPSNAIDKVVLAFRNAGRAPAFMGPPGIGKTDQVRAAGRVIAETTGLPCPVVELHLAQLSEVDVRGYLIPDGDDAKFTAPSFWKTVRENPQGILFLDEFMQAPAEVQKAIAPLLLDRRIGEYALPAEWSVAIAGNGQDDLAGANAILSHVINRIALFEVKPPKPDDWVNWAVDHGVEPLLIAFAKSSPQEVFGAPIPTTGDTPYCTPRSVETLSHVAQAWPGGLGAMVNDELGRATVAATIGTGAAAVLFSLATMAHDLPSYEAVVEDPNGTEVPEQLSHAYATILMLCARAQRKHTDQLLAYITRFNENHVIVGLRVLLRKDPAFLQSRRLLDWIGGHREVLKHYAPYLSGGNSHG